MKIAVGLSGGVDSAVAAYTLQQQGHDVVGVTLCLKGSPDDSEIKDAKRVAEILNIEHFVVDRRELFEKEVINTFVSEYENGRTPNPCIECNEKIKFGTMLDFISEIGCDKLATGHYARLDEIDGNFLLKKALSPKDQSYFLYRLNQSQLSRIYFPITRFDKDETRALAEEAGLEVAHKKDSVEICFVPDDDYIKFLSALGVKSNPGNIIGQNGEILGKHTGITNYTIGQRKGIGAYGQPMFVTGIDAISNTVTIGKNGEQYGTELFADRVSFINPEFASSEFRANVKIRFRAKEQPATVFMEENGLRVVFDEPQRSITPGQSAVIYIDDVVIGGGRIIKNC